MPVLCTYSKMLLQEHFDVDSRLNLAVGELVVIRTRRGVEVGKISAEPGTTRMRREEATAGRVLRRATNADREWHKTQRTNIKVSPTLREARRLGKEMNLPCQFVDVEAMLEEGRSVLYYCAEERIEMGDLPKKLGEAVGHRVDLRQIGARDVARLSGDVGSCGEELCCKTFLVDFVPVSMKMAKNQGLGVDMAKISGMCGRLKCCLRYEDDLYTQLRQTMPKNGQPVTVQGEEGWVVAANLLTQTCLVEIKGAREEYPVAEVIFDPTMGEGAIRRWQREMRDAKAAEAEARIQERDARKAAKDQQVRDRMARGARKTDSQSPDAEASDGADPATPDIDTDASRDRRAHGRGPGSPNRGSPRDRAPGFESPRQGDGARRIRDPRPEPSLETRPSQADDAAADEADSGGEDEGPSGAEGERDPTRRPRRKRGPRRGRGRGAGPNGAAQSGSGEGPPPPPPSAE